MLILQQVANQLIYKKKTHFETKWVTKLVTKWTF